MEKAFCFSQQGYQAGSRLSDDLMPQEVCSYLPPSLPSDDGEPKAKGGDLSFPRCKSFRLATLFWNMEVSALEGEDTAGGPRVPEAQLFQKLRTKVVPKQKETLCVPEKQPASLLIFTFSLRGKIQEANITLSNTNLKKKTQLNRKTI